MREGGSYYRFSKDESAKTITMEVSENLVGPWRDIPEFSLAGMRGYEGPQCFRLGLGTSGRPSTWCLVLDYFGQQKGYCPFVTDDLAGGQFTAVTDFHFPFPFRHGSILAITTAERDRLYSTYGVSS